MQTDFVDTRQAAEKLGLKKNTLDIWRIQGKGPRFTRFGRAIRYRLSDLEDFIAANTYTHTSEDHGGHIRRTGS